MNKAKEHEYYFTRASHASAKTKKVVLTRKLKISSQDAHLAYYPWALEHRRLKQYPKKITQLRIAVIFKPNFVPGWQDLGISLFTIGRYEKSIMAFKELLRLSPSCRPAHQGLMKAIDKIGSFEELPIIYEKIYPDDYHTCKKLFETGIDELIKAKKVHIALQCYKKLLVDMYPSYKDDIRSQYGRLLQKEGFLQEALVQYELMREDYYYDHRKYLYERPLLKYGLMMVEDAVEDLQQFLDKYKYHVCSKSPLYFELVVMMYHLHESAEKIEPYKKGVKGFLMYYRDSRNKQIEETQLKLESETDEKTKCFLEKKINALKFVLDWPK